MATHWPRKKLHRFVGKYVYAVWPAPAITCCHNGVMIRVEGRVTRLATMRFSGQLGLLVQGNVVFPDEVKCPTLHWVGDSYRARTERASNAPR